MNVGLQPGYTPRFVDLELDEIFPELPALLVIGARASGKTTTTGRRARTTIQLDQPAQATVFEADPDAALRGLAEPVLLDEWQDVPDVLSAVKRSVDARPTGGRYLVTGSVNADLEKVWPGTGRLPRIRMYPMTLREQFGLTRRATIFDRIAESAPEDLVEVLGPAHSTPDIRGYVDLALRSGFPIPLRIDSSRARALWLESYIEDLLSRDVEQIDAARPDPERLRRYFEAYALNSSGVADHRTIYEATGISQNTANAYEALLQNLLIAERLPAWQTNRLRRLIRQPKRYLIDAALITAGLRMNQNGVLRDGRILGAVIDTFVAAQLRPEVAIAKSRPRLHHLRTQGGRREVDLIAELGGDRVIGFEIKARAAPRSTDADHLVWFRDQLAERFIAGVVFHTGPKAFAMAERVVAAPISTLWAG